jgi:hypothetical protein
VSILPLRPAGLSRLRRRASHLHSGWRRGLQGLMVLAALIAPLASIASAADRGVATRFDLYLHRASGATADPVNVIFENADPETAANLIPQVLGWRPTSGSELLFWHVGVPALATRQFALDLGHGSRFHIRVDRTAFDDAGRMAVLAGVHLDVLTSCGHIGQQFDRARDLVAAGFAAAGYPVSHVQLGNAQPGLQCNGTFTNGDGSAVVIDLGAVPAPAR